MPMNSYLRTAFAANQIAEKIAMRYWRHALRIRSKSDERDLVTQADVAIDTAVREIVLKAHPSHQIISEELGGDNTPAEWQWIVDPIDGTINFTMGEPIFGISIALLRNGKPYLGVISFPAIGERYWAVAGHGAWVQRTGQPKRRCRVSKTRTIHDARFSMGFNVTRLSRQRFLRTFKGLTLEAAVARVHFCAVFDFMNIARGGMDFYVNYDIHIWDFAAAWCIVQEAGGHMLDITGRKLTVQDYSADTLATNGLLNREVVKRLTA